MALNCGSLCDLDKRDFLARWGRKQLDCIQESMGSEEILKAGKDNLLENFSIKRNKEMEQNLAEEVR